MSWPPTVDELRLDMSGGGKPGLSPPPNDDARLQQVLDAAVSWVQRKRKDLRYDLTNPDQALLPEPDADFRLGTLRLAARLHVRRRSQDGMVEGADLPGARVPSTDADIERLLGIGRHGEVVFG